MKWSLIYLDRIWLNEYDDFEMIQAHIAQVIVVSSESICLVNS